MKTFRFKFFLNMDEKQTKEIVIKSPFEGNPQLFNYVQDHLHEALLPYDNIVAPNKKFALVQDQYTDEGQWWDLEEVTGDDEEATIMSADWGYDAEPFLKVQGFLEFTRRVIEFEYPGIVPH